MTTTVSYCCPTNSTLFCNYCGCAVCDNQKNCPGCKREVTPEDARSRHSIALRRQMGRKAYAEHCAHVEREIAKDREWSRRLQRGGS